MMNAAKELLTFIENSPSMFHSIETIKGMLDEAGFTYLPERTCWDVKQGGTYYTIRNHSSIIAFRVGKELGDYHFQMCASHSDSPTYKIKNVPELNGPGEYLRLDVEAYGGMIDSTWFDRPLTVAGRVLVKDGQGVSARLLYIDKDLFIIPNVAIHFNREVNNGYKYNRQVDLCPLFSAGELKKGAFDAMIAKELGVAAEDILGKDLFLVNRQPGTIWGYADEFVSSPKLDDLQCAYVSLKAFLEAKNERDVSVYCCFDNEEVGSNTKQGAMSTFLQDPNHGEKTDAVNCSWMNKGIVIKESANQKYTTDAFSRAVFTNVCNEAGVPVQVFANRSDILGGSTLGNLSNTQVSVHAVDIGLPQLAMHSCYETAGVKDVEYAIRALTKFYQTTLQIEGAERVCFE